MQEIEKAPVYSNARIKPLNTYVHEKFKFYSIKSNHNDIKVFCNLSLGQEDALYFNKKLENQSVKNLVFSNGIKPNSLDLEKMLPLKSEIKILMDKGHNQDAQYLYAALLFYEKVKQGEEWSVPFGSTVLKLSNIRNQSNISFEEVLKSFKPDFSYKVEHLMKKYNFERIVFVFSLFIFLLSLLLPKNVLVPYLGQIICFSLISLALVFRVYVTQRAPVSNMYETVLFSTWCSALIPFFIRNKKVSYQRVSLFFISLCFLLFEFGKGMFSSSMDPLRPVLRDNFWLSTHVLTIVCSYSLFALSWLKSNYYLLTFNTISNSGEARKEMLYLLRFGCIFLSAGIFLGALWADYSWGRFWAWDPKETWSLIALLFYIAILHIPLRFKAFLETVSMAFIGIIMAWFGVNYLIASGLHSYGFGENGASFTLLIITIQLAISLYVRLGSRNEV